MKIKLRVSEIQFQQRKEKLSYLFAALESGTGEFLKLTYILDK